MSGQKNDRLQALKLFPPRKIVEQKASLSTPKTMECSARRVEFERRRFLLVKWAGHCEVFALGTQLPQFRAKRKKITDFLFPQSIKYLNEICQNSFSSSLLPPFKQNVPPRRWCPPARKTSFIRFQCFGEETCSYAGELCMQVSQLWNRQPECYSFNSRNLGYKSNKKSPCGQAELLIWLRNFMAE